MKPSRAASVALPLALALAPACGCRGFRRAPPRPAPDAIARPAASDPVATVPLAALPAQPLLTSASLADESPREPPPAPPPGCAIVRPLRVLTLPLDAPAAFATAAGGGGRMLLAVATRARPAGDAGPALAADSASWVVSASAGVRWTRGPVEPDSPTAVAGATPEGLAIAWARPGIDERADGAVRIAWFPNTPRAGAADRAAELRTIAVRPEPSVSDLACAGPRCTLAFGWVDRYADPQLADRAAWVTLDPSAPAGAVTPATAADAHRAYNAIAPGADGLSGTALGDGRLALFDNGGAERGPLGANVLDVARVGDALYAVVARAPGADRCQPGAWRLELVALGARGEPGVVTPLATTDARPRGARVRAVGSPPRPMVTWLDAPQCAERFFVVRAWRGGEVVAMAAAEEYDVAADGARVLFAVRNAERLRWVEARCP